jgi:hypothetical protein
MNPDARHVNASVPGKKIQEKENEVDLAIWIGLGSISERGHVHIFLLMLKGKPEK